MTKRTSPHEEARRYIDKVVRTHARHGFEKHLADDEYEKAVASAERIAEQSALKKRAA
jgi:hypothetical protein